MSLNIGDRVKFLNDIGGGTVAHIIDKKTISIRTDDDWEIPVLINEVIKVEKVGKDEYVSKYDDTKHVQQIKKPAFENIIKPKLPEKETIIENTSILFALVPKRKNDPFSDKLNVYIINDSEYQALFNYIVSINDYKHSKEAGMLEPDTKLFLETIDRDAFMQSFFIQFQVILYKSGKYTPIPAIDKKIKIDNTEFFKRFEFGVNDFFDENAIIIPLYSIDLTESVAKLTSKEIEKIKSEKEPEKTAPKPVLQNADILEVDLHIHELVDDDSKLSSAEIIKIQMSKVRETINESIAKKIKKVVLIHGVGAGTLKFEIRKELDSLNLEFQDASFKEYGFGATMVIIPQNYNNLLH